MSADKDMPRFSFLTRARGATIPGMAAALPGTPDGELPDSGPDSWGGETDWNLIRNASGGAQGIDRDHAWVRLVERYRGPVRRVLGRHLRDDPDAEEATNDFFSDLFQRQQILNRADPEQGRFRCYIQGVMRRYALQWKRSRTLPRATDLDAIDVGLDDSDAACEREEEVLWADAILEHALERLASGSPRDAEIVTRFYGLLGRERATSEDLAREKNMPVATFHVALHRARARLKSALLEELRPMVASREDLQQETQFLVGRLMAAHPGFDLRA